MIGGIEASLRRLAHYDYWSDRVKRSDPSGFRCGSYYRTEWANAVDRRDRGSIWTAALAVKDITFIDGTVYKTRNRRGCLRCNRSCRLIEEIKSDKQDVCGELLYPVLQYRSVFRETAR